MNLKITTFFLLFIFFFAGCENEKINSALASGFYAAVRASGGDGHSFNDPLIKRQWHYYNDGSTTNSVAGADANIFPAWKVTTGHPSVIVAVVDGGIDFSHPDLAQNMWINEKEVSGNNIDDDNNGYVDDIYGFRWGRAGVGEPTGEIFPMDHGSHCAGTMAAVNNNGVGLAGVAGGNGYPATGVRLMSCQTYVPDLAFPDDPHGNSKSTSQTPDAFAYAADNGAVIDSDEMPELHEPIMGDIGYHIRAGKHDVTDYDWERYMDFTDKHFLRFSLGKGKGLTIINFSHVE